MTEIEDVLRDAGYEIVDVPRPEMSTGCSECGRDEETANGVCIRCAVKDAPMYWDGAPEPRTEGGEDGE